MSPRTARLWACGVLAVERGIAVITPLVVAGLALAAACLWGVFDYIPRAAHGIGVAAVLLGASVTALRVAAHRNPTAINRWDDTQPHHPLRTVLDTAATGNPDLWAEHQAREQVRIDQMAWPRPRLSFAAHDPMGLRHLFIILIIIGIWQGQHWRWPAMPEQTAVRVQAIITPPAYTQLPPVYLRPGDQVAAPEGSVLHVHAPATRYASRLAGSALERPHILRATQNGSDIQVRLARSGTIQLNQWTKWAQWRVSIVPDRKPVVHWAGDAQRGAHNSLVLPVIITDDYDGVRATLVLADTQKPLASLRIPPADAHAVRRLVVDLSTSAVAGQTVTVQVIVRDAAGQLGRSIPRRITVPERIYKKPLAQSLIEIRGWLADLSPAARWAHPRKAEVSLNHEPVYMDMDRLLHAPHGVRKSARALYALALDGAHLTSDPIIRMGLRMSATQLGLARSAHDVRAVSMLLWRLADRVETGTGTDARAAFEAARIALSDAIQRGAGPEERAALTDDLQQAFANLMRSLSTQAAPDTDAQRGDPADVQDLLDLMREADRLASTGDVAGAQALLETLGQIMANLRLSAAETSTAQGGDTLTPLMDAQRHLADQTRRWMSLDPAAEPLDQLARQQAELAEQAKRVPTARDSMQKAAQALREEDPESALRHQKAAGRVLGEAMAKERAAKDPMAKALGNRDPLGRRTTLQAGASADPRAEARAILERIRKRLEDQTLPEDERLYLEHLIRNF